SRKRHQPIAIRVGVRRAQLHSAPRRRLDKAFNSSRDSAWSIHVTTETPEAQRIDDEERLKINYPLQARVEISDSDKYSIARQLLIHAAVDTDRLLSSKRWVAESLQAETRKCSGAKPLKK